MFFSTELLAYKKGPYYRIWKYGCNRRCGVKKPDLRLHMEKLTTELLDWIKREDYRRLSLHLSSALTVGATRLTLEQSRRLLLDIISIRGNAARAARAALALRSNQIDLNTNQSMNQTQLVFGDEEVGNFDATLLDQEADQNLFVVPNPVGPFGPDPTLMREFDVPSNAEIENPDDPFADNFGEDPTRPSLTNFDDIFGNIDLPAARAETAATLDPPEIGVHAPPLQETVANEEELEDPSAPQRSNGPENGVKEKPPPKFEAFEAFEAESPNQEDPIIPDVPRFEAEQEDPIIPEVIVHDAPPEANVPVEEQHSTEEDVTPGIVLRSPDEPPPRKRRRIPKRKLRVDKNLQLDMGTIRAQRDIYAERLDGEPINVPFFRPGQDLIFGDFDFKGKSSELRGMLMEAAKSDKMEFENSVEWDEESEEDVEEPEDNQRRESTLRDDGETASASNIRPRSPSGFDQSQDLNFDQNDQLHTIPEENYNLPSPIIEKNKKSDLHSNIDLNVSEAPRIDLSQTQEEIPVDSPPPVNVEVMDYDQIQVTNEIPNEMDAGTPIGEMNISMEADGGEWSAILIRNGANNRRRAARMFEALLIGVKNKKFRCEQDGFFEEIYVSKL